MILTVTAPERVAPDVGELVGAAVGELLINLGVETELETAVETGQICQLTVEKTPIGLPFVPLDPPDPTLISRSLAFSAAGDRVRLTRLALADQLGVEQLYVVSNLAHRLINPSRAKVDIGETSPGSGGIDVAKLEAAQEASQVEIAVPSGDEIFGEMGIGIESDFVPDPEEASPWLSRVRRDLRDAAGLLVPMISVTEDTDGALGVPPGTFRVRVNDVWLPPLNNDADAALNLSLVLRACAGALVTRKSTHFALIQLADSFPELVRAAMKRHGLDEITRVLRYLSDEGVDIGRLRAILDSMFEVVGTTPVDDIEAFVIQPHIGKLYLAGPDSDGAELTAEQIAECARMSLARMLTEAAKDENGQIRAHLIDPAIEQMLIKGSIEEARRAILQALETALEEGRIGTAIVTSTPVRRKVWETVTSFAQPLSVLGFHEVAQDASTILLGFLSADEPVLTR